MDKIIAAISHRDYIVIFTEYGDVFQIIISDFDYKVEVRKILSLWNMNRD